MLDVRVVIVNHRSGARLARLLEVVAPDVREVVVVDNASDDGSAEIADGGAHPDVTLQRRLTNTGFSAAANDGARGAETSWLLFANPDVHPRPGDLERLLGDAPPGILAPVQTDDAGEDRPETGGWEPSLRRLALWAVVPGRFHGTHGPWIRPPIPQEDRPLDWVSGALMAVPTDVFERLGGFDERFFLYVEDVDLCRRARALGAPVLVRGTVRVYHEVADGDPERRARAVARWVTALGIDRRGWRRRVLGAILLIGFSLRALTGDAGARGALPRCIDLIVSRW